MAGSLVQSVGGSGASLRSPLTLTPEMFRWVDQGDAAFGTLGQEISVSVLPRRWGAYIVEVSIAKPDGGAALIVEYVDAKILEEAKQSAEVLTYRWMRAFFLVESGALV